jgi:NifU-like protein involved in Fe-S cluster formation
MQAQMELKILNTGITKTVLAEDAITAAISDYRTKSKKTIARTA